MLRTSCDERLFHASAGFLQPPAPQQHKGPMGFYQSSEIEGYGGPAGKLLSGLQRVERIGFPALGQQGMNDAEARVEGVQIEPIRVGLHPFAEKLQGAVDVAPKPVDFSQADQPPGHISPAGAAGVCHKVKGSLIRLLSAVDLAALDHGPRLMGESRRCHQQAPGLQRFFGRRLQQVDRLTRPPPRRAVPLPP